MSKEYIEHYTYSTWNGITRLLLTTAIVQRVSDSVGQLTCEREYLQEHNHFVLFSACRFCEYTYKTRRLHFICLVGILKSVFRHMQYLKELKTYAINYYKHHNLTIL